MSSATAEPSAGGTGTPGDDTGSVFPGYLDALNKDQSGTRPKGTPISPVPFCGPFHGVPEECWSVDKIEELIQLYKRNPCLWNPKDDNYRAVHIRARAMKQMVEDLGENITIHSVKTKIKSLRTQFAREWNKINRLAGMGKVHNVQWKYFESLQFLNGTIMNSGSKQKVDTANNFTINNSNNNTSNNNNNNINNFNNTNLNYNDNNNDENSNQETKFMNLLNKMNNGEDIDMATATLALCFGSDGAGSSGQPGSDNGDGNPVNGSVSSETSIASASDILAVAQLTSQKAAEIFGASTVAGLPDFSGLNNFQTPLPGSGAATNIKRELVDSPVTSPVETNIFQVQSPVQSLSYRKSRTSNYRKTPPYQRNETPSSPRCNNNINNGYSEHQQQQHDKHQRSLCDNSSAIPNTTPHGNNNNNNCNSTNGEHNAIMVSPCSMSEDRHQSSPQFKDYGRLSSPSAPKRARTHSSEQASASAASCPLQRSPTAPSTVHNGFNDHQQQQQPQFVPDGGSNSVSPPGSSPPHGSAPRWDKPTAPSPTITTAAAATSDPTGTNADAYDHIGRYVASVLRTMISDPTNRSNAILGIHQILGHYMSVTEPNAPPPPPLTFPPIT